MTKSKSRVAFESHHKVMERMAKKPTFQRDYDQRRLVQEVAIAVKKLRVDAGLTQEKLAKLIDSTQPVIARLEKGIDQRTPKWDVLKKIAHATGMQLTLQFSSERYALVEVNDMPISLDEHRRRREQVTASPAARRKQA